MRFGDAVSLAEVTAGNIILDKGEYVLKIGEPKPFFNVKTNDLGVDESNFGIGYAVTVQSEGEYKGQSLGQLRMYLHSPGALKMSKQFAMAALGFDASSQVSEAEFNAKYTEAWGDAETGNCAPVWKECGGRLIKCAADSKPNKVREGELQQTFRWFPFGPDEK